MESVLGNSLAVFVVLTVIILGGAACLTGQAVAATWRPVRQIVLYCLLIGLADRFLVWSLFDGDGLSISGYLIDTGVLTIFGLTAYRITHVTNMVKQYPWLFERTSLWSYRERPKSLGTNS